MPSKAGRRYADNEYGGSVVEAPHISNTPQMESLNLETEHGRPDSIIRREEGLAKREEFPSERPSASMEPKQEYHSLPAEDAKEEEPSSGGSRHSLLSSGQLYKSENGEQHTIANKSGLTSVP